MGYLLAALLFIAPHFSALAAPATASPRAAPARSTPGPRGGTINDFDFQIDEIRVTGATVFPSAEILKVLEFSGGDRIERKKVVESSKNIQELYRQKGYEDAGVEIQLVRRPIPKTKVADHILEVKIREGLPTRVLELAYEWPRGKRFRFETRLEERNRLAPGEIFDEEKIGRLFKSLQDDLGSLDFMGPKVELVEALTAVPPAASSGLSPTTFPAAKWVRLKVAVDVGERVTFGFRGNKVLSYQDLNLVIDEQRLVGLSQDYIQRIRGQIEDEYRKIGHDRVKIDTFTFEDAIDQRKHVTFDIHEGVKIEIEAVNFDGQLTYTEPQLAEKFRAIATGLTAKGFYVDKDVQKTAELLIERVRSEGFLSAKLISVVKTDSSVPNRVRVTINFYEGEQTRIEAIEFRNLTVFRSDEVKEMLGVREGEPLNLYALNEGIERLKGAYRSKGYYETKIENEQGKVVSYFQENRRANVLLEFDEGGKSIVSKIQIEGNGKTHLNVVERELQIHEGEVLEEPKWLESEARLRRLGLFSSVNLQSVPEPDDIARKVIRVKLEEGTPGVVAGGLGLRNDLGGRVFGQLSYANLWGKNHILTLTANANRRFERFGSTYCTEGQSRNCFIEYDSTLSYTFPWALWGPTVFRPAISTEKKVIEFLSGSTESKYTTFDVNTQAVTLTLERTLLSTSATNIKGLLTYSFEHTRQYHAKEDVDNQTLRIGAIIPSIIIDRRDSVLTPTKGTYTTLTAEYASPELLSTGGDGLEGRAAPIRYTRTQFRNDVLIPLPADVGLFLSYRMGLAYNLSHPPGGGSPDDPRYAIPLVKQYSLGGVGSIRGFREQSLTVPANIAVRGYTSYVNYRAQLDLPFSGNLRFGPFWDAGAVRYDEFRLDKVRQGIGAGFRYRSPVGPVNFDVGFNPYPQVGEDSYRVHFSIGMI